MPPRAIGSFGNKGRMHTRESRKLTAHVEVVPLITLSDDRVPLGGVRDRIAV